MLPTTLIISALCLAGSIAASPVEKRATAQIFKAPSTSPLTQSDNYVGKNNGTLPKQDVVKGKAFDRLIHIWLENTDYASAASTDAFQNLAKQGQVLTSYYGVTHPSEPNYMASVYGDFFALSDDTFNYIPSNITSVFDLFDEKNISYSCYQENLPSDGYTGYNYTSKNYVEDGKPPYAYYVRKHNPCAFGLLPSSPKERFTRNRNFNDFAADASANVLPAWLFITPNMVNDGHDTSPAFFSNWTSYFLGGILNDTRVNNDRTLILLTFDENETYNVENRIYTVMLGGALPKELVGTTDDTYLTHYSGLSTAQVNWDLKSLGRGDANATMANVIPWVANITGYKNVNVTEDERPLTNLTGVYTGPLSATRYVPFYAPANVSVGGATGRGVMLADSINKTQSLATMSGSPFNWTAAGKLNPYNTDPASVKATNTSSTGQTGAAMQISAQGTSFLVVLGTAVSLLF